MRYVNLSTILVYRLVSRNVSIDLLTRFLPRATWTVARYLTIAGNQLNYLYGHPLVVTPRRQKGKGDRDKPTRKQISQKAGGLQGREQLSWTNRYTQTPEGASQSEGEWLGFLRNSRLCLLLKWKRIVMRAANSKLPRRQIAQRRSDCYSRQPEIGSPHAVVTPLYHAGLKIHSNIIFLYSE